ncbi:MAG: amino acid dehydrogenase [Gammaproteobacteria bacterium]|nr:amino acid dehydrogenase [Gammaproteobacteria bacterium]MBT8110046.1 amino acid dehydrogenase [Gammaproteobacteria bacterium]NND47869.1 Glu/Leu/Phe/Val dehydrogenase [Woeseiaceae bacterium]NNL44750.1 Glu/Leu/Phe/Val dehydrogenase [Woeseiaceae bacterium]
MAFFMHPEFDKHESLHFFHDEATGLQAIVALHSTALGPAAGGCRRWIYANEADALTDALRLSRGMTYKNAVAGLRFGGGKAVILGSPDAPKSPELFTAFGRAVDSLGGRYITAEDVGCSVDDMRYVREQTEFVSGLPQTGSSAGGDPSPWTAIGCLQGIEAAVESRLGSDSLKDVRVAVQGVGHVGLHLCRLLHEAGAVLFVSDVNRENLKAASAELPVTVVAPTELLYADVDVLAPCALGNILTSTTIPRIRAKVIAGAANNQLATVGDGARLAERDILYAPDYVINAGGIISVAREYYGSSSEEEVRADVSRIRERLQAIFDEAKSSGRPTNELADELARSLVAAAK